mgnify:CR=1 FL=1
MESKDFSMNNFYQYAKTVFPEEVTQKLFAEPITDWERKDAQSASSDENAQLLHIVHLRILRNARDNFPDVPSWCVGNAAGISYLSLIGILNLIYPKHEIILTLDNSSHTPQPYTEISSSNEGVFLLLIGQFAFRALELLKLGLNAPIEKSISFLLGDYAEKGYKQKLGQKAGHAAVHGTPEVKALRREKYQTRATELIKQYPKRGLTQIREMVAAEFGVSSKTIQRNTPDLAKHKKCQKN